MRFAYIDSQGNEVAIPSVDALALRIELGAVIQETQLYDGSTDRWGPAQSHEIFHALSRGAAIEDPEIPTPPRAPDPDADPDPSASLEALGLDLRPPEPDTPARRADQTADDLPTIPMETPEARKEDAPAARSDFPGSEDFAWELRPAHPDPDPDVSGDLELDPPLDTGDDTPSTFGFADDLDIEPPMSEFDPSSPPMWMEQDGPTDGPGEPTLDFSPVGPSDRSEASGNSSLPPLPPRLDSPTGSAPVRSERSRPPQRRRRRKVGPAVLGILFVAAAGTAGWYGRQALSARSAPVEPRPEVVLPPIPEELEGTMRELAAEAIPLAFDRIEARAISGEVPEAPGDQWLAGVYLANASDFEGVEEFWRAVQGLVRILREEDGAAFHQAYREAARASELDPGAVELLVERADSGFLATRDARYAAYDLLDEVVLASLALHEFLLANQDRIRYTPATGFLGNPIEEAVPETPAVGEAMWDRVEAITTALDRYGTLDRVTRERLSAVLRGRIQEVGIR